MSVLFTFPHDAESCSLAIASVRSWAAGSALQLNSQLHLSSHLHLSGHRLELAVLFAAGASLMLCSMLVRKAAAALRRPVVVTERVGESPAPQLPLAEGAKR